MLGKIILNYKLIFTVKDNLLLQLYLIAITIIVGYNTNYKYLKLLVLSIK